MEFIEVVMLILGLLVGGGAGGLIAWLVKSLKVKAEMAILEKELLVSKGRAVELVKLNADLTQKYTDAQSALANTLAAMELLKAYQMIDIKTKDQIRVIQDTFIDGKATDDTMVKYKEMLKNMNDQSANYNKGKK